MSFYINSIKFYFSPPSDGTPPSSVQSSPSFSNFQEKRRSNMSMRNPIRQMVNRAGSLRCMYTNIPFLQDVIVLFFQHQVIQCYHHY